MAVPTHIKTASAVCSRCGRACIGCCGRSGQVVYGVAVLPLSGVFQWRRRSSATIVHRALPVCVWSVLGMAWATAGSNVASAVSSRCGAACTGCCSQLVFWVVILPLSGVFQLRRRRSATTVHRALPVYLWPGLGMPWVTARLNTDFVCAAGVVVEPALGAAVGLGR